MKFETKYKLMLYKGYFDKGYAFTNPVKYLIILLGIGDAVANKNVNLTLLLGFIYLLGCFIFGWLFYKYNWIRAETEVGNRFNYLAEELREKVINGNK